MSRLENKIEAKNRSIAEVLESKKYTVDYYQREYSWQQKHIEQLVTDLATTFLSEYESHHERPEVENYNSYYLGPFVLSEKEGKRSVIDGQQRLTSLTLILVFLNMLPTNKILGSPFTVTVPVPICGLFFNIVANLISLNFLPDLPILS